MAVCTYVLSSGRPDAELFRISYGHGIPCLLAGEGIVCKSKHTYPFYMYVRTYVSVCGKGLCVSYS